MTTPAPVTTDVATTPAPVTTTTATTTTDTAKTDTVKVDTPTAKATSTKTAQASHPRRTSDDSINVGGVKLNGGNVNGQISKIMNRSDVKSMLSQYGLN